MTLGGEIRNLPLKLINSYRERRVESRTKHLNERKEEYIRSILDDVMYVARYFMNDTVRAAIENPPSSHVEKGFIPIEDRIGNFGRELGIVGFEWDTVSGCAVINYKDKARLTIDTEDNKIYVRYQNGKSVTTGNEEKLSFAFDKGTGKVEYVFVHDSKEQNSLRREVRLLGEAMPRIQETFAKAPLEMFSPEEAQVA